MDSFKVGSIRFSKISIWILFNVYLFNYKKTYFNLLDYFNLLESIELFGANALKIDFNLVKNSLFFLFFEPYF